MFAVDAVAAGAAERGVGGDVELDKGLLDVRGTPLVQQVAARLAGQVDALLLSANRSLDRYRALGFDPLTDGPYVDAGPLAGLRALDVGCGAGLLSEALAREVGSRGITVNCIAPGFIATDMTEVLPEAQKALESLGLVLGKVVTKQQKPA